MKTLLSLIIFFMSGCLMAQENVKTIYLDEMDLTRMNSGWGEAKKNSSVTGKGISIGGQAFARGVGTHALSSMKIDLKGEALEFSAQVGVDDGAGGKGKVEFFLVGDDRILWKSGVMRRGQKAQPVHVDLKGLGYLGLLVLDAGNGTSFDHADWALASISCKGDGPVALPLPVRGMRGILTPKPPLSPRINGARIYGVRRNAPVIYRIPVTGQRPIKFEVTGLPEGLLLDPLNGIITGRIGTEGSHKLMINASNEFGTDSLSFSFSVGSTLALTPPMGWNSWYIHYDRVSDSLMRQAAYEMVKSGMADYGYSYVNIDDCWMVKVDSKDSQTGGPLRNEQGELLTNKRFPDMNGLTDYIHSYGLKAGTYISPGPRTCGGYSGSYQHEQQDAGTFARWGFDFLKYDWCSYQEVKKGFGRNAYIKPYSLMWNELQKQDRDIVLNLCQYGMKDVWEWGASVGNSWRTTGDLGLEGSKGKMPPFYSIGIKNAEHWEYAHPGAWNDPDYLLIGWVGSAFKMGEGVKTSLTQDEQYFYMSMWSMMAAPLIFSGDMGKLDPFTLNVLCNNEVIAINQDVLGKQAKIVRQNEHELVLVKDLEDGSKAVGLFNIASMPVEPESWFRPDQATSAPISIPFEELGILGSWEVRDAWRHQDIATATDKLSAVVPYHGVALYTIRKAKE